MSLLPSLACSAAVLLLLLALLGVWGGERPWGCFWWAVLLLLDLSVLLGVMALLLGSSSSCSWSKSTAMHSSSTLLPCCLGWPLPAALSHALPLAPEPCSRIDSCSCWVLEEMEEVAASVALLPFGLLGCGVCLQPRLKGAPAGGVVVTEHTHQQFCVETT